MQPPSPVQSWVASPDRNLDISATELGGGGGGGGRGGRGGRGEGGKGRLSQQL